MTTAPFALRTALFAAEDLRVVSLRGREALSELFSFQLVVQAGTELEGRDGELVGSHAVLTLSDGRGAARRIEAVMDQVRAEAGTSLQSRPVWRLRLVPPLALLKRRFTSRIFQDQTVPQVIQHVLSAASIPVELRLSRAHAVRGYCVQYRESDLAFVKRLAAEEGIAFCFSDAPSDDPDSVARAPVIFLDAPAQYTNVDGADSPPALALRRDDGLSSGGMRRRDTRRSRWIPRIPARERLEITISWRCATSSLSATRWAAPSR